MPQVWVCRSCDSVPREEAEAAAREGRKPVSQPLTREPEGACPHCRGFYRHRKRFVGEGEVEGAEVGPIEEGQPVSAGDLMASFGEPDRQTSGLQGLDHVLGGGLPPAGACFLLYAPAGSGKTTLMMKMGIALAKLRIRCDYVSTEYKLPEVAQQFKWMGKFPSSHFEINCLKSKDELVDAVERSRARVYIVDSLHEVTDVTDADGYALSTGHAHAVCQVGRELKEIAGAKARTIFCIAHCDADGKPKGGTSVQHLLDGNLALRWSGIAGDPRRILQFEGKCRVAPQGKRALFLMNKDGFEEGGPLPDEGEAEPVEVEEAPARAGAGEKGAKAPGKKKGKPN